MNKCEMCNVHIENLNKERVCAFEHNGDKDICPFDDRYIDLSEHDAKIRADVIDECKEVVNNILNYYRNEYHFGVTFNVMCNSINDRIEMLKEQKND